MVDIKQKFIESNALLNGHFLLSSGLHSKYYMQSALVLKDPKYAEFLAKMLKEKINLITNDYNLVVSPSMGGVIIGHEVAKALGVNFLFSERVDGKMILRRGFNIEKGSKIVIVEDVFTTGKSTKEVIELVSQYEAKTVICASIVDRSDGNLDFKIPYVSLLSLDIKSYSKENCPMCKKNIPLEKPGSRFLKV